MRSWIARRGLRARRYGYDVSYLLMMLNCSPSAFFKFAPVMIAAPARNWSSKWRWNPACPRTRSRRFSAAIPGR
jgi:hypothetical protein